MTPMRPRLLLADDHTLVGEAIARALGERYQLLAIVDNGKDALETALALHPDVCILDVSMPRMTGIEAARKLRAAAPGIRVVFLTMHSEPQYIREAMATGARGYVLKTSGIAELEAALREALAGRTYIEPALAEAARSAAALREPLTPRQREVLRLVAAGMSAKEVAGELGISTKTAEFHKAALMRRLNADSSADLVRYAIKHGIAAE